MDSFFGRKICSFEAYWSQHVYDKEEQNPVTVEWLALIEKAVRYDLSASSVVTQLRVPKESSTLNNFQLEQMEEWNGPGLLQLQHKCSQTKPRAPVMSSVPIRTSKRF